MLKHLTILKCSQKTTMTVFILIGSLFCLTGCAQLYKLIGLTEEQTEEQLAEDQKTIIRTITLTRNTAADIITTAVAGIGTIASGFLAKWLRTERKITKALITGVEKANDTNVKESIATAAGTAGIEPKLHDRVKALT